MGEGGEREGEKGGDKRVGVSWWGLGLVGGGACAWKFSFLSFAAFRLASAVKTMVCLSCLSLA